jgi:hypothetical protein
LGLDPTKWAHVCNACGKLKYLTEYNLDRTRGIGVKNICRECLAESSARYHAKSRMKLAAMQPDDETPNGIPSNEQIYSLLTRLCSELGIKEITNAS